MPTSNPAIDAVVAMLTNTAEAGPVDVEAFFRYRFIHFPEPVRAVISDFLMTCTSMPSAEDLARLKAAVDGPAQLVPEYSAPRWDDRFGPPMEHTAPAGRHIQQVAAAVAI